LTEAKETDYMECGTFQKWHSLWHMMSFSALTPDNPKVGGEQFDSILKILHINVDSIKFTFEILPIRLLVIKEIIFLIDKDIQVSTGSVSSWQL
jgi:hypothetical protein